MTNRSDYLFEWRREKVRKGPPVYVAYPELFALTGYQSQYGVTRKQAAANTRIGHTKEAKYEVYCDTLLVDFDDCTGKADAFDSYLRKNHIAFLRGVSGGRSDHFHVALDPLFGTDTPYSCKLWVIQFAPGADVSVYHRNGMFRLFGTRHEKTGKPKVLTSSATGKRLCIPYHEEEPHVSYGTGERATDLEGALAHALSLLGSEPTVGNRHQAAWSFAKNLLEATQDVVPDPRSFVEGFLYAINAQWKNPKPSEDLRRILGDLKLL